MAYYGFKPAEQAIQIGDNTIVSADIADGSIVNADLNASAAIAMSKTQFVAGTGLTLATNTLNLDTITSAASLVTVGTIGTGVWQGTAINQTYLVGQSGTNTGDQTLPTDFVSAASGGTFAGTIAVETANVGTAHGDWDTLTLEENGRCGITLISPTNNYSAIDFADADGNEQGMIQYSNNDNAMFLKTAGTTAITLDSSQNATFAGQITGSTSGSGRILNEAGSATNPTLNPRNDQSATGIGGVGTAVHIISNGTTNSSYDGTTATFAGNITTVGGMIITQADGSNTDAYFGLGNDADYGQIDANETGIWNVNNNDFIVGTNNTLALTIDNSQNATFAGHITLDGSHHLKHRSDHGDVVSQYTRSVVGNSWADVMDLTFPGGNWATATVMVVFADSYGGSGRLISKVRGYASHGGTSVTNYVDGSSSFSDNFNWEYQSNNPNVQRLRIKSNALGDVITCLITVVMSSQSGDSDPTVTFYG